MKGERLSWTKCPRCGKEKLLVSELPISVGRTCYEPGCYFWDYKYTGKPSE